MNAERDELMRLAQDLPEGQMPKRCVDLFARLRLANREKVLPVRRGTSGRRVKSGSFWLARAER